MTQIDFSQGEVDGSIIIDFYAIDFLSVNVDGFVVFVGVEV